MRFKFFVSAVMFITSAALTIIVLSTNATFYFLKPSQRLEQIWKEDLSRLQKSGKLPKEWRQIGQVELKTNEAQVQEWLSQITVPIQEHKGAAYKLEIFMIHWIETDKYGVIVQYHLVDQKTNNTIWELDRTFRVGLVL